jgi:hypothetical protein
MRGDFSRIRFSSAKQYTAVLEQQGRVRVDADSNEQSAIEDYLRRTAISDIVGEFGGPEGDCGFEITLDDDKLSIGKGRYYVDGLIVENPNVIDWEDQPFLLNAGESSFDLLLRVFQAKGTARLQLWLEVWQRVVTPLDDPCLMEPALGQADTTLRLQTVWRVIGEVVEDTEADVASSTAASIADTAAMRKAILEQAKGAELSYANAPASANESLSLYKDDSAQPITGATDTTQAVNVDAGVSPQEESSTCCDSMYNIETWKSTGAMRVDLQPGGDTCGCDPISTAGYRGLENQLYRVEIHTGGDLTSATFKWSRENGSVVVAVTGVQGAVVQVASLGPDANLGFEPGQWVELSDDFDLFGPDPNLPGALYQIQSVDPAGMSVTVTSSVLPVDPSHNARMRRWDQSGPTITSEGIPVSTSAIALENGIEVTFQPGTYASGDYWTIPARTATGQISWPPCGSDGSAFQKPSSIVVYSAPLACVRFNRDAVSSYTDVRVLNTSDAKFKVTRHETLVIDDCRRKFPPLTDLYSLATGALKVTRTSWENEQIYTVDDFLVRGLALALNQAATSPWSGGNFQLILEFHEDPTISANDTDLDHYSKIVPPLFRRMILLDAPVGIQAAGKIVTWLAPFKQDQANSGLLIHFSNVLNQILLPGAWLGVYGRVRIRLLSEGIYATTQNETIYLDGSAFGTSDGESISLTLPTGNRQRAADFHSWFYLVPTPSVLSLNIYPAAVEVEVDWHGNKIGMKDEAGAIVTSVNASILLSYYPAKSTVVQLSLTGTGAGTVASIAGSVTIPAGSRTASVPITIARSPGSGQKYTYTLSAFVVTKAYSSGSDSAVLTVSGGVQPPEPIG